MSSIHTWSWNDFAQEAKQLVQWMEPGEWEWMRAKPRTVATLRSSAQQAEEQLANGYLKSKVYYLQPSSIYSHGRIQSIEEQQQQRIHAAQSHHEVSDARVIEEDDAASTHSPTKPLHTYHYHICYSTTFQVPLLAIDACELDGTPLEREQILLNFRDGIMQQQSGNDAPSSTSKQAVISRDVSEESNWQFLTQVDHPVLARPIYALHPCKTSEWMATILHSSSRQLSAPATSKEEEVGDLDDELAAMQAYPTLPMAEPVANATSQPSKPDVASNATSSSEWTLPLLSWLSLLAPLVACPVSFTPALKQHLQQSKAVTPQP